MKILVTWTHVSGYLAACLNELERRPGFEVHLVHMGTSQDAAFEARGLNLRLSGIYTLEMLGGRGLRELATKLSPDLLLCCGWHIKEYRDLARGRAGRIQVMTMDNQWKGSPRQILASALGRASLVRWFDAAFVPGDRQAQFASLMGFPDHRIWRGSYSGDQPEFAKAANRSFEDRSGFLFIGRLVPEKGVDVLIDAYTMYSRNSINPWGLEVCGSGPMSEGFIGANGVSLKGFVQPNDLGEVLAASRALVLPSRFEPWGVVVHEAASAGLPIICSTACGASVSLVEDGWNGFTVAPGNVNELAAALGAISGMSDSEWLSMSRASTAISSRYTPGLWASNLLRRTELVA